MPHKPLIYMCVSIQSLLYHSVTDVAPRIDVRVSRDHFEPAKSLRVSSSPNSPEAVGPFSSPVRVPERSSPSSLELLIRCDVDADEVGVEAPQSDDEPDRLSEPHE